IGLRRDTLKTLNPSLYTQLGLENEDLNKAIRSWGPVVIACAITIYFYRQNLLGLHESSDKALKIMLATTVMAVIMLVWCGITLTVRHGPVNPVNRFGPDLHKKIKYDSAVRYRLTGQGLQTLASDGIPEHLLARLRP